MLEHTSSRSCYLYKDNTTYVAQVNSMFRLSSHSLVIIIIVLYYISYYVHTTSKCSLLA